jgi:hypothetical protein
MKRAAAAPLSAEYDIFLSHASLDAEVIAGVKIILEQEGRTVYVDWIEDIQLDRSRVTVATARRLRARMRKCKSLIFASSEASPNSKWMPWELGFFDGHKPGRVVIMPLVETTGDTFRGQEYLGLYPNLQRLPISGHVRLGLTRPGGQHRTLSNFITLGSE